VQRSGPGEWRAGGPGHPHEPRLGVRLERQRRLEPCAVVTVGAAAEWSAPATAPNHSNGIYLAPFSSRGSTLDGRLKPDIRAPGVSVTAAQAGSSSGSDSFTYRPGDGSALGNPALVTLAVVAPLTAEALSVGRYKTSGKGRGKTALFIESTRFTAGAEVIFRARSANGAGTPVTGVTVELTVSGPEALTLQSAASDASGIAEARWQTAAPALKGKRITGTGATKGTYTATVTALNGGGAPGTRRRQASALPSSCRNRGGIRRRPDQQF